MIILKKECSNILSPQINLGSEVNLVRLYSSHAILGFTSTLILESVLQSRLPCIFVSFGKCMRVQFLRLVHNKTTFLQRSSPSAIFATIRLLEEVHTCICYSVFRCKLWINESNTIFKSLKGSALSNTLSCMQLELRYPATVKHPVWSSGYILQLKLY